MEYLRRQSQSVVEEHPVETESDVTENEVVEEHPRDIVKPARKRKKR